MYLISVVFVTYVLVRIGHRTRSPHHVRKKFQDFTSKTNSKDMRIKFPPTGGSSAEKLLPVESQLMQLLDAKNSAQVKGVSKGIDTLMSSLF